MQTINNPFRRAGLALLVIGLIDVSIMAYSIANNISYSSSFNILAVIAGAFLLNGSVKAARIVRWLSAFLVVVITGILLLSPVTTPIELLAVQFKLNPSGMLKSYVFSTIYIGFFIWIYFELSATASLATLTRAGYKTAAPKSAFYIAIVFILAGALLLISLFNSEFSMKATTLAKMQLGEDYKYHISGISTSGDHGSAQITAYSEDEIKNIRVEW